MPVYQTPSKYGWFIKIIFGVVLVALLAGGVTELGQNPQDGYALFGISVAVALILWWVLPHRLEIYEDRLRIVLGGPFGINVRLDQISEVRVLSPGRAFVTSGVQMATDTGTALLIKRRGKMDISISPRDRDEFLRELEQARNAAGEKPA